MCSLVLFVVLCYTAVASAEAPCKELNDGNKIPIIALGTGRGTANGTSNEEVRHAVFWALEAGYRHIDTAAVYKDETQVGQGIADAIAKRIVEREQIFVTTKLWSDKHSKDQVVPALRESLNKLGLDYVDLYLIHFPIAMTADGSPSDIDYLETWRGMEEARGLNLTRSIGVSNFNSSQIDRLYAHAHVKPAVNQIEVNPTMTQEPLVAHCAALGIAVMAYSPFGFLVSRRHDVTPPPKHDDPTLVVMADKYGKTTGQIVLRYLETVEHVIIHCTATEETRKKTVLKDILDMGPEDPTGKLEHAIHQPRVLLRYFGEQRPYFVDRGLIPIPKSTNKSRIAQNIDLFDCELTKEEVVTISAFNKNLRVIDGKGFQNFPHFPFVGEELSEKSV